MFKAVNFLMLFIIKCAFIKSQKMYILDHGIWSAQKILLDAGICNTRGQAVFNQFFSVVFSIFY